MHNAGVFVTRRAATAEGRELVFATNVLAPVVLTEALGPSLRAAESSASVCASGVHVTAALALQRS